MMLSLGQFYRVVEMLYGMRHFDQAALFVESCFEFGLLKLTEETSILCSDIKSYIYIYIYIFIYIYIYI